MVYDALIIVIDVAIFVLLNSKHAKYRSDAGRHANGWKSFRVQVK